MNRNATVTLWTVVEVISISSELPGSKDIRDVDGRILARAVPLDEAVDAARLYLATNTAAAECRIVFRNAGRRAR